MSVGALQNHMRLQALMAAGVLSAPRSGLVTDYDPKLGVKVMLQPNEIETGWLPINGVWAGNGWGAAFGPVPGQQAVICFLDGSVENGVCLGFIHSDDDEPIGVPSGEAWFVHEQGATLKFTNDGKLSVTSPAGVSIQSDGEVNVQASQINATGPTNITGDVTVTGNATITENATIQGTLSVSSLAG